MHPTQDPNKWNNPHKRWFTSRIETLTDHAGGAISQNSVAKLLKLSRSGLSRRLDGELKFTPNELVQLSKLLSEDLGNMTKMAAMLRAAWKQRPTD